MVWSVYLDKDKLGSHEFYSQAIEAVRVIARNWIEEHEEGLAMRSDSVSDTWILDAAEETRTLKIVKESE
jgi:hypothetical protein